MSYILQDLSAEKLTAAIEENLWAMIPYLGRLGRWSTMEPRGVRRSIVDVRFALFNSVMDARLEVEEVQPAIQTVVSDSKSRQVPVIWWTGPATRPMDIEVHLKAAGFYLDEDSCGMAVRLESLNENLPAPAGLSIELAEDDATRWEWSLTMAAGFEIPPGATFAVDVWHKFLSLVEPDTMQPYLARLDGEPVAVSLLFLGAGVAGIYAVATIPDARRKGVGAQVTLHPLLRARELGYKAGVLQASEMGEGVYRSIGFQEHCKIRSYRYVP